VKSIEVERGAAVLQCIASDEKLLKALGAAKRRSTKSRATCQQIW